MLNLNSTGFPVLSTGRLVLRQLVPEYAIQVHQLRSDPEVNRYLDRPTSAGVKDALTFISKIEQAVTARDSMYWVITLAGSNNLIGTICFWNFDQQSDTIEIGYELMPAQQGKGIMAEAIKCVIDYAFNQLNAKAITAFPTADNIRSIALLKKFNFLFDQELLSNLPADEVSMQAYVLKYNA